MTQPERIRPLTSRTRRLVEALAIGGTAFVAAALIFGLGRWASLRTGQMTDLAVQHFRAVIGLPFAALAALSLVLVLESQSGPIEFEALGFRFRGAAGPLVMWVLCFLAIVAAIAVLW